MSTVRTVTLQHPTVALLMSIESVRLYRLAIWTLLVAKLVAGWGVQWDIQWHVLIGRDTFWIAPHVMTYAGVAAAVLISFGVLVFDTGRRLLTGREPSGSRRVLWLTGTLGFHVAAWGIALTVLAAPIDDLWHRLFGLDVTLWSPPHLLGLFGAAANTFACFFIAREAYPRERWRRNIVCLIAAATFYGMLATALQPSGRFAYLYGGLWFYTYPILAALLLPLGLVTPGRLMGRRWAPLAILTLMIVVGLGGATIARVGFETLKPVSVIQDEILKDPNSPIAVAHAIARKNGVTPGRPPGGFIGLLLSFLPVGLLVAIDPRRRPVAATLVYALGVFAMWLTRVGRTPAFQPMMPSWETTTVALAITLGTALVGAVAARWVADVVMRATEPSPTEEGVCARE
jgi:hypothetical protein